VIRGFTIVLFGVPGILDGKPALPVALVGSFAVAYTTIPLAHGWGPKSLAALLGALGSLLLTALPAVLFRSVRPTCRSKARSSPA
jgi:uncharacterized membrane protein